MSGTISFGSDHDNWGGRPGFLLRWYDFVTLAIDSNAGEGSELLRDRFCASNRSIVDELDHLSLGGLSSADYRLLQDITKEMISQFPTSIPGWDPKFHKIFFVDACELLCLLVRAEDRAKNAGN